MPAATNNAGGGGIQTVYAFATNGFLDVNIGLNGQLLAY